MADLKTRPTGESVEDYLRDAVDDARRPDCIELLRIMRRVTGVEPQMWGPSIIGFGSYHYRYASGREGDWFLTGFAVRARDLTVYVMAGFDESEATLARLGRHRLGKSCLYIKRLADVDVTVLEELIAQSVAALRDESGAGEGEGEGNGPV
jgi:hypothetical protein